MNRCKKKPDMVILGAGLAGLSAAYHAQGQAKIFEAASRVGGKCATDQINGYAFDQSGHLLHLRTPYIQTLIKKLLPSDLVVHQRDARIHLMDIEVRYPFQANSFGLPTGIKTQALLDYLQAAVAPVSRTQHFSQWAKAAFGQTMARLFFEPYNRKLWTVSPEKLTLDWMGPYVPKPDPARVIRGAFADIPSGGGYNETFLYPRQGGIEILANTLAKNLPQLQLNAPVLRIDQRKRIVEIKNLGQQTWQQLISTMPLPELVVRLENPPNKILTAVKRLRSNSVLVIHLGVRRPKIHPGHWIYFPEKDFVFYRVGFPSNFGQVAPAGCSSLYAEVGLKFKTGWTDRQALAQRVRKDLLKAQLLRSEDVIEVEHLQYLTYGYVIYDQHYRAARTTILDYLLSQGIYSIGRWGNWEYSAMEDALLQGKETIEKIGSAR